MAHKLTKEEITAKFRVGRSTRNTMLALMADANPQGRPASPWPRSRAGCRSTRRLRLSGVHAIRVRRACSPTSRLPAARGYPGGDRGRFKVKNKGG